VFCKRLGTALAVVGGNLKFIVIGRASQANQESPFYTLGPSVCPAGNLLQQPRCQALGKLDGRFVVGQLQRLQWRIRPSPPRADRLEVGGVERAEQRIGGRAEQEGIHAAAVSVATG